MNLIQKGSNKSSHIRGKRGKDDFIYIYFFNNWRNFTNLLVKYRCKCKNKFKDSVSPKL